MELKTVNTFEQLASKYAIHNLERETIVNTLVDMVMTDKHHSLDRSTDGCKCAYINFGNALTDVVAKTDFESKLMDYLSSFNYNFESGLSFKSAILEMVRDELYTQIKQACDDFETGY
tara:strand:- start:530 stop:883 length:354 start_codon:yes stop_codon:yes gene_type:complete